MYSTCASGGRKVFLSSSVTWQQNVFTSEITERGFGDQVDLRFVSFGPYILGPGNLIEHCLKFEHHLAGFGEKCVQDLSLFIKKCYMP